MSNKTNVQAQRRQDFQIQLRRLADMMRSNRFEGWLNESEGRFVWATPELFAKLDMPLYSVLAQGLNDDGIHEQTVLVKRFADACEVLARAIIEQDVLKTTKVQGQFVFTQGFERTQLVYELVNELDVPKAEELADLSGVDVDYVLSCIEALVLYTQARMTLYQSTRFGGFEGILYNIHESYLMAGNPYDLLAHGGEQARNSSGAAVVAMRTDRCEAVWVDNDIELANVAQRGDYALYRIRNNSGSLDKLRSRDEVAGQFIQ